jgi:hypothetical protein
MFQLAKGVKLDVMEHETGEKKTLSILPNAKNVTACITLIVILFTAVFAVKSRYDAVPKLQMAQERLRVQAADNIKSHRLLRIQLSSQRFMLSELIKKNFPGPEGTRILEQARTLEDQLVVEVDKEAVSQEPQK